MAKSFTTLGRNVPAKPLSERDFFDLTQEPVASTNPLSTVVVESVPEKPAALPHPTIFAIVESVAQEDLVEDGSVGGNTLNAVSSDNPGTSSKPVNSGVTGNSKPKKKRPVAATTSNTENIVNSVSSDKGVATDNTVLPTSFTGTAATTGVGDVRQTFILGRSHLEQLRDYVHARRAAGEYAYSQKQALQEALDLLFLHNGLAGPRPNEAREREQQHRERIKEGRQAGPTKTQP